MRIVKSMEKLRGRGDKALIPYLMAGDPDLETTLDCMRTLKTAGADLIELGVPFSDPMADGPVIQAASERALAAQVNLHGVLDAVDAYRKDDQELPIVLMTYLNPIEQMGIDAFADAAHKAGVDGVLIVDLLPEEADAVIEALAKRELVMIFLVSLTTQSPRLEAILERAQGFVYCISLKGVTGSGDLGIEEIKTRMQALRERTDLPLGVGFGIRDAKVASQLAPVCDALVVGSAIVELIDKHHADPAQCRDALTQFAQDLKAAMNQNRQ